MAGAIRPVSSAAISARCMKGYDKISIMVPQHRLASFPHLHHDHQQCPTMIEMLMAAEPTMVLPKIAEWAVMCYSTVAQHHSAVDKVAERADIVQHHEHGSACRQPLGQHIGKHPLMLEVNPRGGLVQDEEVGVDRQVPARPAPVAAARRTARQCRR